MQKHCAQNQPRFINLWNKSTAVSPQCKLLSYVSFCLRGVTWISVLLMWTLGSRIKVSLRPPVSLSSPILNSMNVSNTSPASCFSSLTISILYLQCDLRAWRVHICVGAPPVCSVHATEQEDDLFPTEKVSCMDLFSPFSVCRYFFWKWPWISGWCAYSLAPIRIVELNFISKTDVFLRACYTKLWNNNF